LEEVERWLALILNYDPRHAPSIVTAALRLLMHLQRFWRFDELNANFGVRSPHHLTPSRQPPVE
jgi:hypothetical protein